MVAGWRLMPIVWIVEMPRNVEPFRKSSTMATGPMNFVKSLDAMLIVGN